MSSTQENKKVYQKWNKQDKKLFIKLNKLHGKAFEKYQSSFPKRTVQQIKSFYYNEINKQNKNSKKSIKNLNFPHSQYILDDLQAKQVQNIGPVIYSNEAKESKTSRSENQDESLHLSNDFFE
ncbi:SANT/Myb_domain [Hexamita inflata]|uniref:SANT/Myb domain n=1 Tax=Hexamita inflata TaxID=28002 RepID=A0AA86Q5Z6_9EUKA|nr:SANT/Myb domain [Hexamita inflata]